MTRFHLARRGYGSLAELEQMDTPEFLDLLEFEQITLEIERHYATGGGK